MRRIPAIALFAAALAAQTPDQADLARRIRELRSAIEHDDLTTAATLATGLDERVQALHRAWLIRDADERVGEVLTWLPVNSESLWVNQEPFTINPEEAPELLYARPAQLYSIDRLAALNDGKVYRALANCTIRLVVAATRDIRGERSGIPSPIPAQDVAYFYYFADPIDLPLPGETIQGRPVLRGVAKVDAGAPARPGEDRPMREDENWIALAQPDLLVVTNNKDLLDEILERIVHGSRTQALPGTLPEWGQVDRRASLWGLRHYAGQSKAKPKDPGFDTAMLPQPDSAAVGATIQFDSSRQQLEIRYISSAPLQQRAGGDPLHREFQIHQPQAGVWSLVSDVRQRGPWPIRFAMTMLGFGSYR